MYLFVTRYFVEIIYHFVVAFHEMLFAGDFFEVGGVVAQGVECLLLLLDGGVDLLNLAVHFAAFAVRTTLLKDVVLVEKHNDSCKKQRHYDISSFRQYLKNLFKRHRLIFLQRYIFLWKFYYFCKKYN